MATIYGNEVAVKVGTLIKPDGWAWGGRVIEGDSFSEFRLQTNGEIIKSLAAKFEITGRTTQKIAGDYWVRVKITFVGDGEPDTVTGGFMRTGWM